MKCSIKKVSLIAVILFIGRVNAADDTYKTNGDFAENYGKNAEKKAKSLTVVELCEEIKSENTLISEAFNDYSRDAHEEAQRAYAAELSKVWGNANINERKFCGKLIPLSKSGETLTHNTREFQAKRRSLERMYSALDINDLCYAHGKLEQLSTRGLVLFGTIAGSDAPIASQVINSLLLNKLKTNEVDLSECQRMKLIGMEEANLLLSLY